MDYCGFTPEIITKEAGAFIEHMAAFALPIRRCPVCQTIMLDMDVEHFRDLDIQWHGLCAMDIQGQLDRAGWRLRSQVRNGYHQKICVQCAKDGLATFICEICNQKRSATDLEITIGDDGYMCRICYETMPAQQWQGELESLQDAHRYDR